MPPPPPTPVRDWHAAEQNAATWMRWWGYFDAVVTPGGADAGIDIRARDALAQVKYENQKSSRSTVQNLFGARGNRLHQKLFFFAKAGFSRQAVEYADESHIALFRYDADGAMTAVSAAARRVLADVAEREAAAERARREEARRRAERAAKAQVRTEGRTQARHTAPATGFGAPREARLLDGDALAAAASGRADTPRPLVPGRRRRTLPWLFGLVLTFLAALGATGSAADGQTPPAAAVVVWGLALFLAVRLGSAVAHNRRATAPRL